MHQIITHFTDDDLYKLTMCCAVIDNFPRARVKYAFTDRGDTRYPAGFARELREQVRALESVTITDREVEYMKRACPYLPHWFYDYLRGFRYDSSLVKIQQDSEGRLSVEFEGSWAKTILLEVKVLAIISELYHTMSGHLDTIDMADFEARSKVKARKMIEGGCVFSDMGTRRRASFAAQDRLVGAMAAVSEESEGPGRFTGTSNVWFAMEYDLVPIGTMAHEFIAAIAGMYGPQMANHHAMRAWSSTFRGSLGTFLYDTYGWRIFSLNFSEDYANMFKGLRVDSGDNLEQLRLIVDKYRRLGIDPSTKQVVFSNALDVDRAIALRKEAEGLCRPSFGIGTHFTNDFPGFKHLNIVIKLVAAKITEAWDFYNDTCKLSEDHGKYTGRPDVIRRFCEALHINYKE